MGSPQEELLVVDSPNKTATDVSLLDRIPVLPPGTHECYSCSEAISYHDKELVTNQNNMEWHRQCMTCCICKANLSHESKCYFRDGRVYCKNDYLSTYEVTCLKCQKAISGSDLVRKIDNELFHADCFTCNSCNMELKTGDKCAYFENESLFLCNADMNTLPTPPLTHTPVINVPNIPPNSMQGFPTMPMQYIPQNQRGSVIKPGANHTKAKKRRSEKKPRVRTVLSEQQVNTLTFYYKQDPRPTTQVKEKIAEETALPKKVISVWFQNRRCKDKKKQDQDERIELAKKQDEQKKFAKLYSDFPDVISQGGIPIPMSTPVLPMTLASPAPPMDPKLFPLNNPMILPSAHMSPYNPCQGFIPSSGPQPCLPPYTTDYNLPPHIQQNHSPLEAASPTESPYTASSVSPQQPNSPSYHQAYHHDNSPNNTIFPANSTSLQHYTFPSPDEHFSICNY